MCGIAALLGAGWDDGAAAAMVAAMRHRGPDAQGTHACPSGLAALGHARLSIIDRSEAGRQPMRDAEGRRWIVFNGEIYNYLELRRELGEAAFRTGTDTEVLLAAYARWGERCLDRLVGMFAFAIWDSAERTLFAARDRWGVKPLYWHRAADGRVALASEIPALGAAGVPLEPDDVAWATYLANGAHDRSARTFWRDVRALPPGCALRWSGEGVAVRRWYDLAARVGDADDERAEQVVAEEYRALLEESVRLRFRADVPVGIALSGGVDSSALLGLVRRTQGEDSEVAAYTFVTGDPAYDELPWVRRMLARTRHPLVVCRLAPADVPPLAESVQRSQAEPFGGLPTLAYARLFEEARARGTTVLLDGQGMDEQWAGYDYYRALGAASGAAPLVQGTRESPVRPDCLRAEFRARAEAPAAPRPFADPVRNVQLRDLLHAKLPRALRFNDRASMRASVELREPFLDHRLVELALRQPVDRKVRGGEGKRLLRAIVADLLPAAVATAPKRPLQTPQREWLRGPLRGWCEAQVEAALDGPAGAWLDADRVRAAWRRYADGAGDTSFFVWQWVSLGLLLGASRAPAAPAPPAARAAGART